MYEKILVALDKSPVDQSLIPHIASVAKIHHSHLLLVHVAEGWAARHYSDLQLKESEEIIKDREYLENVAKELRAQGLSVSTHLALGEPSEEIVRISEAEKCDLIAMTSHGHGFLADLFLGSAIEEVRHHSSIPILVVKKAKSN
jgi:nucleotide-binding universal stress UspA family protein